MKERSVNDLILDEEDTKENYEVVDFLERLAAHIIDSILMIVILLSLLPTLFHFFEMLVKNKNEPVGGGLVVSVIILYLFWPLILRVLYSTIYEGTGLNATPGKFIMALQVVDDHDHGLSFARAMVRNLAKVISALILYFGFLMVLFNSDRKALHDNMTQTKVIRKSPDTAVKRKFWISTLIIIIILFTLPGYELPPLD